MRTPSIRRTVAAGSIAAVAAGLMAGCGASTTTGAGATGGGGNGGAASSKTLTIPIASGWDEDKAVTYLWQYVLQKHGYTVKTPNMDIGIIFTGISKGNSSNVDVFFDTWLPKTHAQYWKKIHNKVEDLNVWYDQATLNIAVPKYLKNINSIADLKGKASMFNGTITGIDPGAGLTSTTKKMMPEYGLKDYTLKTSSTAAMLASLQKAIKAKQPIVVTLWHPHWAYKAFPIKDLKDPKGAMGGAEKIHVIAKDGFAKQAPAVNKSLKSFTMDDKTLASLENVVLQQHKDNPQAGVQAWVKTHKSYVDGLWKG